MTSQDIAHHQTSADSSALHTVMTLVDPATGMTYWRKVYVQSIGPVLPSTAPAAAPLAGRVIDDETGEDLRSPERRGNINSHARGNAPATPREFHVNGLPIQHPNFSMSGDNRGQQMPTSLPPFSIVLNSTSSSRGSHGVSHNMNHSGHPIWPDKLAPLSPGCRHGGGHGGVSCFTGRRMSRDYTGNTTGQAAQHSSIISSAPVCGERIARTRRHCLIQPYNGNYIPKPSIF